MEVLVADWMRRMMGQNWARETLGGQQAESDWGSEETW